MNEACWTNANKDCFSKPGAAEIDAEENDNEDRAVPSRAIWTGARMRVISHTPNVLCCASGVWRVWSLSDGYLDMPASLLRDTDNNSVLQSATTPMLRLPVTCFTLAGPGVDGILIDSGGGGYGQTTGRLEQTMAEAGIDPALINVLVLTHAHRDHIHGLLTVDGRVLLPNLKTILIPEGEMPGFMADARVARFLPLLKPTGKDAQLAPRLRAIALYGHAPGHTGYAFDTGEDRFLFGGDIVHVPAMQFDHPTLTWGYDHDQAAARETRLKFFREAAESGTWIGGAHLERPGIGRLERKGEVYRYEPVSG